MIGYRDGMSFAEVLGWYVLLPLAFAGLVTLLVYAPSWVKGPKYRPGLNWWAEPAWIGGGSLDTVGALPAATEAAEGGGCSARW